MLRQNLIITLGVLAILAAPAVSAQTNAWTNATSGNWEDMHWSLGTLPGSGQTVMITNSGWKAVAIGPNTVPAYPQTLNPSSIYLSGYTDSFNVLLLNYIGYEVPLTTSSLVVSSNAALTTLASAITVNNSTAAPFSVGGTVNHGDGSTVSTWNLNVGDIGPGSYNMTNGALLVNQNLTLGGNFPSHFRQYGGTNYPGALVLLSGGEYDMYGGDVSSTAFVYRGGSGTFRQFGGVVKPDKMYVTMSAYLQAGGYFSSGDIELPGVTSQFDYADFGSFLQTGGTNNSGSVNIGTYYPPFLNASAWGSYTLSNGVLITSSTSVGPWGSFQHSGGSHTTGNLGLHGAEVYTATPSYASYSLSAGIVSTPCIGMNIANFYQTGGTNQVSGNLMMTPLNTGYSSSYHLSGGLLQTSNTTFSGGYGAGGIQQSGGTFIVSNLLTLSRYNSFSPGYVSSYLVDFILTGGQLTAQNIQIDRGATFHHRGGTIINPGIVTLSDGNWEANASSQQLGRLLLSQGTNSQIYFATGSAVLRFANSSSIIWSNQALLTIEDWNGSVSGGGAHQLYVGSTSAGLTPQQLSQVRFESPGGASGAYPATILATGEIVPSHFIASRQSGNTLQISWAPGMTLQSSTNIFGPYLDVSGATSPYTVVFTTPRRFFRLRQ